MIKTIKILMNDNTKAWIKGAAIFAGIMLFFLIPGIIKELFGREVEKKIEFGGLILAASVCIIWMIKSVINDE